MLLAVYLFFDKRIQLKKRVCSFLFFMFMICSFCFTELDVMWTAFVRSYSYAFRWAFTFAFLMIVLASGAVAQIQKHKLDKSAMLKALGVIGVVFLLLDLNGKFTSRFVAYVYIAAVLFYAALLFAMSAIKSKKAAKALCLLLVCIVSFAELGANATVALKGYNDKEKDYESYTSQMGSVINDIKASDSSLYRIERIYHIYSLTVEMLQTVKDFFSIITVLKAIPQLTMPTLICLWQNWLFGSCKLNRR